MHALLAITNLVKRFPGVDAVNGISFSIPKGRCFGLLGPNGAGKTTTVEMLEGILTPTSGEIRYKNEILGDRFRDEAGIMFQSTALQEFITVRETLNLFRGLYPRGLSINDVSELCSLGGLLNRDNKRLSGGQRQRLLFAIALINDPQVLFLDEPTTGLDPQARRNFWELITRAKQQDKTVILTTHYMEEAYRLCDDIVIMDRGRIIAEGTPQALLAEHYNDVVLQLPISALEAALSTTGTTVLKSQDTIEILTRDVDETIRQLLALQVSLSDLTIRPRTLEDLFLELTGRQLRT